MMITTLFHQSVRVTFTCKHHLVTLTVTHTVNSQSNIQASGSGQAEMFSFDGVMTPYVASGSCVVLKRTMEMLAQFAVDHSPPTDNQELLVYCQALGPVLATLHAAGREHVGAVLNFS